jgi:hypothetical protein
MHSTGKFSKLFDNSDALILELKRLLSEDDIKSKGLVLENMDVFKGIFKDEYAQFLKFLNTFEYQAALKILANYVL